ncbi:MAG: exodeoxyribonuclease VII large subunit [Chlamydiae bacterium]|nr:exodeoxyribonuclease VII large subunit [Chlamydiota bacterium]
MLEKNQVWTVSGLTQEIKNILGHRFSFVRLQGEVSDLREQSSGHIYFTLKDIEAQISAVLFKTAASKLERKPKAGDTIIVEGQITVYPPKGSYQIVVNNLSYVGVGELLLQFHQLKSELERQGWFDPQIKKPLPAFPKTIGVITSPTGAVIQDILNVLSRRLKKFHLILHPVRVQGKGAEIEIARAIDEMNVFQLADVLIVGRGGGSLEDLWPFNEKIVAEAIFRSKIPVVSAVGHETDYSISDFVADVRAPTPSAAAELISQERSRLFENLRGFYGQIARNLVQRIRHDKTALEKFSSHPLLSSPYAFLDLKMQKVDDISHDLYQNILLQIERKQAGLEKIKKALDALNPQRSLEEKKKWLLTFSKRLSVIEKIIHDKKLALTSLNSHLQSMNPKTVLKKGYCIPFRENKNSVIMARQGLQAHENITLLFHDGYVTANVIGTND